MHEPAECKRRAEADDRGHLRYQATVGSGNAAEQRDPLVEPEHREQRRREHERRDVAVEQRVYARVEHCAHAPGRVELQEHAAYREQQHVEDDEVVEEPQMGERERTGGRSRRILDGGCERGIRAARDAPDQRGDRQRHQDDPAHEQRREDSLGAVCDEAARAAPLDHEAREQPGDHEERGHAPGVDQEEQGAERRALRHVVRRNRQEE